jgi:hypothetical protein
VHNDLADDILTGGTGRDWYIIGASDVANRKPGDVVTIVQADDRERHKKPRRTLRFGGVLTARGKTVSVQFSPGQVKTDLTRTPPLETSPP